VGDMVMLLYEREMVSGRERDNEGGIYDARIELKEKVKGDVRFK